MNKAQIWSLFAALALFLGLYFGLDASPDKHRKMEPSSSMPADEISFEGLLENAKSALQAEQLEILSALDRQLETATNDKEKAFALKDISAFWYKNIQLPLAGSYAEEVASIEKADSSWSVAGGTYFTALVSAQDPGIRGYCAKHAVTAFENAALLAPEKIEHQVNLALVWAEDPPPNNPMQAVLMLRDLESKHPENPSVYNALGRLAIKTGQWQRAIERLEKSWNLNKNNPNTPCLLARAYQGIGNTTKATEFSGLCKDQ